MWYQCKLTVILGNQRGKHTWTMMVTATIPLFGNFVLKNAIFWSFLPILDQFRPKIGHFLSFRPQCPVYSPTDCQNHWWPSLYDIYVLESQKNGRILLKMTSKTGNIGPKVTLKWRNCPGPVPKPPLGAVPTELWGWVLCWGPLFMHNLWFYKI